MSNTAEQTECDDVADLPWVVRVTQTDREESDYEVVTDLSVVRVDHEVREMATIGYELTAVSTIGHYGCVCYVTTR